MIEVSSSGSICGVKGNMSYDLFYDVWQDKDDSQAWLQENAEYAHEVQEE